MITGTVEDKLKSVGVTTHRKNTDVGIHLLKRSSDNINIFFYVLSSNQGIQYSTQPTYTFINIAKISPV